VVTAPYPGGVFGEVMGPQFLCFGTTRSGTTFLHARLREHPRVWMPPQKEIHYFSYQRERGFWNRKHFRHVRDAIPNLRRALRGKRGPAAELAWQLKYLFAPRSDAWFLSLFDAPPGLITGHIEPSYATLPAEGIAVVRRLLPDVKLIYMMRDPIDRAWSSVTKSNAKNKQRPMAEVSEAEMFEKLERSALRMSRHIDHIRRWEAAFPPEQFFFGYFDEIERDPVAFLARVCAFLEIEPLTALEPEEARRPINDTRRFKVEIPPHVERYIAERLIEPTRELHERFGGYTTEWYHRMERVLAAGERAGSLQGAAETRWAGAARP
jgi:hypothetical protein